MTATFALYELILLALMMWREARSLGREGMRAVGWVAWNRHNKHRGLWQVITDDAQFTSINPPGKSYDAQLDVWPRSNDALFLEALKLATAIQAGENFDPTGGATWYWNPKLCTPTCWFARNIAPQPQPLAPYKSWEVSLVQPPHIFYRAAASVASNSLASRSA